MRKYLSEVLRDVACYFSNFERFGKFCRGDLSRKTSSEQDSTRNQNMSSAWHLRAMDKVHHSLGARLSGKLTDGGVKAQKSKKKVSGHTQCHSPPVLAVNSPPNPRSTCPLLGPSGTEGPFSERNHPRQPPLPLETGEEFLIHSEEQVCLNRLEVPPNHLGIRLLPSAYLDKNVSQPIVWSTVPSDLKSGSSVQCPGPESA